MGAWILVWARFTRVRSSSARRWPSAAAGGLLLHQGGVVGEARPVEVAVRHHPVFLELEQAIELALLVAHVDRGFAQRRLGALQVGRRLGDLRLEQGGLDFGDEIALSDPAVEVGVQPLNRAGDLAPHLNGDQGAERSRWPKRWRRARPARSSRPRTREPDEAPSSLQNRTHAPDQGNQQKQREQGFRPTRDPHAEVS